MIITSYISKDGSQLVYLGYQRCFFGKRILVEASSIGDAYQQVVMSMQEICDSILEDRYGQRC